MAEDAALVSDSRHLVAAIRLFAGTARPCAESLPTLQREQLSTMETR
jgi:hypothetical protein